MRVLLLRIAPTWYCCTQPRAWSRSARRWRRAERKTRASPAVERLARPEPGEQARGHLVGERLRVDRLQAVVGGPAAALVEERVPLLQRLEQRAPGVDRGAGGLLQLPEPRGPRREVLDEEGLVRPPGREDLRVGVLPLRELRVGLEGVGGVVGAAHHGHAELLQQAHRGEAVLLAAARWPGRRSPARWRGRGASRRRTAGAAPCGSSGRAGCRGCRAPCGPRPRTSPSRRRRPCRSARPRRSCASPATCSGRPPARPR